MELDKKLVGWKGILFDVLLTVLFYIYMISVCAEHAPAQTESVRIMVGAFCALPLAGTFWLALCLFRVTLVDQLRRRKR